MKIRKVTQKLLKFYCALVTISFSLNMYSVVYLDSSFGTDHTGIVTTTIGSSAQVSQVFMQTDGSVVLAGTSIASDLNYITLARYTSLGVLDATFGTGGIVTTNVGTYASGNAGFVQADTKLVGAGQAVVSGINNLVLTRYSNVGVLDPGFGTGGVVTTPVGDGAGINAAVLQPADQRIVVAGTVVQSGVPAIIVARYDSAGSLDTANFGNPNGYTITPISYRATGRAVALQADGQILVGGFGVVSDIQNGAIARYTTAGALDTVGFGSPNGYITELYPPASGSTVVVALGLQSDGKIIALMQSSVAPNTYSYLARYNTNGTIDTGFGTSGFVTIDSNGIINGNALAIEPAGGEVDKIVVTGYSGNDAAVMRYLADGSALDTTFGNNGIVTTTAGSSAIANSVTIQSDGKIIIAGSSDANFFTARYYGSNATDGIFIDSPIATPTTTNNPFTISGSATEPNYTVKVYLDTTNLIATTTTNAYGHWDIGSFATTTGAHTITAELWDGTPAMVATQTINISVNAGAAVVTIASPANGSTILTSTTDIYGGSNQQAYQVQVSLDSVVIATVTTDSMGQWNAGARNIPAGNHTIDVALLTTAATAQSNFTVSSLVGPMGPTGLSGATGISGVTGASGATGQSGITGASGVTGFSGTTGITGFTGITGAQGSGITGQSGSTGWSGLTGFSGSTGISGTTGLSGFTGPTGVSGITGQSGITGASGVTGISGITGETGFTGITGAQGSGITGQSGSTGFSGQTGLSGTTGLTGASGLTGLTGVSGVTGESGITGASGVTGISGITGETGFTGITGAQGSGITGQSGLTGASGQTGMSGTTGLTGATGLTGVSGVTGQSGTTGASGVTGISGTTGTTGITGISGSTGFSGITGLSGLTGRTGATGFSGTTGTSGLTGVTGYTGGTGSTGLSSITGISGLTGISGHTGLSGVTGLTGRTGITGITGATGISPEGNVVRVDSVYGNDTTCVRNRFDLPCLTIAQGLSLAQSGDLVWVFPGTYAESGLVVPSGVAIRGVSLNDVKISKTGVTADTDLLTMGDNTRVEDVALTLTSAGHYTLRGVLYPGTTTTSAKLRTATVTVDNSGAGAGTSNVYGIHSYGTGTPDSSYQAVRAVTVKVNSAGSGVKRALLVNTAANYINVRDSNFYTVCPTTACTNAIGAETNFAGSALDARISQINGDTADISQTLGTITLATTVLGHSTANGNSFSLAIEPATFFYATTTTVGAGLTRYLLPGTAAPATTDTLRISMSNDAVIKNLRVRAGVTINGRSDVYTILNNGVATTLTVTIVGTGGVVSAADTTHSVAVVTGDALSLRLVTGGAFGNTDEITATIDVY